MPASPTPNLFKTNHLTKTTKYVERIEDDIWQNQCPYSVFLLFEVKRGIPLLHFEKIEISRQHEKSWHHCPTQIMRNHRRKPFVSVVPIKIKRHAYRIEWYYVHIQYNDYHWESHKVKNQRFLSVTVDFISFNFVFYNDCTILIFLLSILFYVSSQTILSFGNW